MSQGKVTASSLLDFGQKGICQRNFYAKRSPIVEKGSLGDKKDYILIFK